MEIKFNRRRLLSIDSAINMGRYITSPKEGHEWSESELLLLAGVALAHILFRRECRREETADELLAHDQKRLPKGLTPRVTAALNYVINLASNSFLPGELCAHPDHPKYEKTYYFEVAYHFGEFQVNRVRMNDDGSRRDGRPSTLSRGGKAAGWCPGDEPYRPPAERCSCGRMVDVAAEGKKAAAEMKEAMG